MASTYEVCLQQFTTRYKQLAVKLIHYHADNSFTIEQEILSLLRKEFFLLSHKLELKRLRVHCLLLRNNYTTS